MMSSNEQVSHYMEILEAYSREHPEITYKRMTGKNINQIKVKCNGKNILEVWPDDDHVSEITCGIIYTDFISFQEKDQAIEVKGYDYSPMGNDIFSKYAHHYNWNATTGFHYSKWLKDYKELKREMDKALENYNKSVPVQ